MEVPREGVEVESHRVPRHQKPQPPGHATGCLDGAGAAGPVEGAALPRRWCAVGALRKSWRPDGGWCKLRSASSLPLLCGGVTRRKRRWRS